MKVDETIYAITFWMGVFFSAAYFINGIIINIIGKKILLALWFILCGTSGMAIPGSNHFYVILFFMVLFLTCGVCGTLLSSILIDLYPTNVRAMALCFVLMIGRLGAVAGSNFVSLMIISQCELMFTVFGVLLLVSAFISIILPGR